jgi:hypothetical protein
MGVLWWLAAPLAATALAMVWAGWRGRARDDVRRETSDEALAQLGAALGQPLPRPGAKAAPPRVVDDPSHGVAVRKPARPAADGGSRR